MAGSANAGGQEAPRRKGIDLILRAATVPRRAFPAVRTIALEGVYPNGAARRMGISIPLHLDWTATSIHRIGKYSARLPEQASEGENGRACCEDFKARFGTSEWACRKLLALTARQAWWSTLSPPVRGDTMILSAIAERLKRRSKDDLSGRGAG